MNRSWIIIFSALILYTPLFIFKSVGPVDFWLWMTLIVTVLLALMIILDWAWPGWCARNIKTHFFRTTGIGLLAAATLYAIFYAGNEFSRILFPFASGNIQDVYLLKQGASVWRIGLLISLLIGPAEELIWRTFVQEKLSRHMTGLKAGLVTTFFYTAIHFGSGNVMLILAALVCGLFWGALYFRFKSVWANVISHTIWDLAVFLIFPFEKFTP